MKIDSQNRSGVKPSLACLNCTLHLSALKGFKCNPILRAVAEAIQKELGEIRAEIWELKISLKPDIDVDGVATASFGWELLQVQLGPELEEPVERCRLDIRLQAEAKPDHLHAAVTLALNHVWMAFPLIFVRLEEMQLFGPEPAGPQSVAIQ